MCFRKKSGTTEKYLLYWFPGSCQAENRHKSFQQLNNKINAGKWSRGNKSCFLIDFSISSHTNECVLSLWVVWECFVLCMARNDRSDRVMLANK